MRPAGGSTANEKGESLLELLIALAIIGIAVVAIIGGLGTAIFMSDVHRKQSTAGAALHTYAEAISNAVAASPPAYAYLSCPTLATYGSPAGFSAPTGYTAQVTAISYWNDSSLTFSSICSSPDGGMQKLSLRVASNDGRASEKFELVIRRPCRSTDATCN
jgi:type II secretory pathway pseudopilin PulG